MGAAQPAPRIRGRAAEIEVLVRALDAVASGQPRVLLIQGEAGIGKTRLLEEALRCASDRSMQVVTGRSTELDQARPFGLVASAFGCVRSSPDPRRRAIARLLSNADSSHSGPITVTSDPGL